MLQRNIRGGTSQKGKRELQDINEVETRINHMYGRCNSTGGGSQCDMPSTDPLHDSNITPATMSSILEDK